jgi:hypothetical protein
MDLTNRLPQCPERRQLQEGSKQPTRPRKGQNQRHIRTQIPRFPFHAESAANFSRASLLSNDTTAEAYDLGAGTFLTTAQQSVILGEGEPPLAFDTLVPAGASVEGQRNTVSWTSAECSLSKPYFSASATSIEATTGNDNVVADSLPHDTGAAPENSKEISSLRAGSRPN